MKIMTVLLRLFVAGFISIKLFGRGIFTVSVDLRTSGQIIEFGAIIFVMGLFILFSAYQILESFDEIKNKEKRRTFYRIVSIILGGLICVIATIKLTEDFEFARLVDLLFAFVLVGAILFLSWIDIRKMKRIKKIGQ
jgi:hypothetical protein